MKHDAVVTSKGNLVVAGVPELRYCRTTWSVALVRNGNLLRRRHLRRLRVHLASRCHLRVVPWPIPLEVGSLRIPLHSALSARCGKHGKKRENTVIKHSTQ